MQHPWRDSAYHSSTTPIHSRPDWILESIIDWIKSSSAYTAASYCSNNYQGAAGLNAEPDRLLPLVLSSSFLRPEAKVELVRKVENFYLQNRAVVKDNFDGFINVSLRNM